MVSRRNFLKVAGATAALAAFDSISSPVKGFAASASRIAGASDRLNVAFIGIGNRGNENIKEIRKSRVNINVVALCDVNMGAPHTQEVMAFYPKARRFQDFRKMFDALRGKLDAVIVSTPDFSHFPIAMQAIKEGVHVYCEKPLARTFLENELLIQAAKMHPGVVTQMGNQGHSGENYYQFKAWQEAGIIKNVTAVTAHMNSDRRWHVLDPNIYKYPDADPKPETMDWDVWQMQTLYHDYSKWLDCGNWRCWYDFGMGALGDWGAHILDTIHEFLNLGLPTKVDVLYLDGHNDYFFPMASTLKFHFPRRGSMPACDITWYDGVKNIPELPAGYGISEVADVPTVAGGALKVMSLNPGKEIYTDDLVFKGASHSSPLHIIPEDVEKQLQAEGRLPEVPPVEGNHYENFFNACLGKEKAHSRFEVSGALCQLMNLGVIAQRLGHGFAFDRNTKEVVGDPFASALLAGPAPRKGWEEYYKL